MARERASVRKTRENLPTSRIYTAFDDHRLEANTALLLPIPSGPPLGLGKLVDRHVYLEGAPGRANAGDRIGRTGSS